MVRAFTLLLFTSVTFQAVAGERPINDRVVLRDLDSAFELAAAELETSTVIYAGECSEKVPAWCTFNGQGKLEIRGVAETVDSSPTNITITYTPDGNPKPFALNVGLLVSVCEPAMKQEERGRIIASIIQIAGKKKDGPVVAGKNCDYSVTEVLGSIRVIAQKSSG